MVLEEGLELALALVVLAYLEEEPFDVGVVVVRPQTIGVPSAVVGASLLMMVLLDSVLSSSEDMTAKREVAEDRTPTSPASVQRRARARSDRTRINGCFACGCVLELAVCRVRFARVSAVEIGSEHYRYG